MFSRSVPETPCQAFFNNARNRFSRVRASINYVWGGGGGGFKPKSDLAISVCVLGGGGGVNSLTTMVLLQKLEEEEQNETKTRLFNCCTRGYTNE